MKNKNLSKNSWMRATKVKIALGRIGGAIENGAISTLIAVLTLSFSKSYIF